MPSVVVGDLTEQVLVELAVDLEALDVDRRPGDAADAHREDPDAAIGRDLGSGQRVRRGRVLAVAQQDDDRVGVRAGGHRRGRDGRPGRAVRVIAGRRVRVRRGDHPERGLDAAGDRRPALRTEPVDRRRDLGRIVGRDLDRQPAVAERDDPDPDGRWLLPTNARAAALAASIRVGGRSVAAMLPDTSKARMTVPSTRGTLMTPCGRAIAMTRTARPTSIQGSG